MDRVKPYGAHAVSYGSIRFLVLPFSKSKIPEVVGFSSLRFCFTWSLILIEFL